jgi:hypothetical protein
MTRPDLMRPGAFRKLSSGERGLVAEVFGQAVDAGRVRVFALPVWNRAFVAGGRLVVWPARTARQDFAAAPLDEQAVFVHEMTHVWQAQTGVNLLLAKLRAGDGAQAYAYRISDNRDFSNYNIEQQAMIVQDAFMAARGGSAPHESDAYSAILATWRRPPDVNPREV